MTFNIDFDNELENLLNSEDMNEKSLGLVLTGLNTVLLLLILKKQKKMENVTLDQFNTVLNRIDTATTNIANELRDIKDQVKKYGLPAEAEQNIFARLDAAANTLESLGQTTQSPAAGSPAAGSPATTGDVSPSTDIV